MRLTGNCHLVAGPLSSLQTLLDALEKEGIRTRANPDAYVREYAHFGVDDARELRERASLSAREERRIFVVATTVITAEAQNALLKTLEEPPGNALFFFLVPSPEMLLPTLLSRMQRVVLEGAGRAGQIEARDFLAATPANRIEMLKPLLEKGDDERRDVSGMIALLSDLERSLARREDRRAHREAYEAIYRARKYMGDKGALIKPLLEQVALLVPITKA